MAYACTQPNALLGRELEKGKAAQPLAAQMKIPVTPYLPQNMSLIGCISINGLQPYDGTNNSCNDFCSVNNKIRFCITVNSCPPVLHQYLLIILKNLSDYPGNLLQGKSNITSIDVPYPCGTFDLTNLSSNWRNSTNNAPFPYGLCANSPSTPKYIVALAWNQSTGAYKVSPVYKIGIVNVPNMAMCPL